MAVLGVLLLLLPRYILSVESGILPGSSVLMQGYDYIYGNPMSIKSDDPGYREDIFELAPDPSQKPISWGGKSYQIPNGTTASCEEKCVGVYSFSEIVSMQEYYNMLYEHVSMSKKGLFESFSLSETYKQVSQGIVYNKNMAVSNYETCAQCHITIDKFTPPSFTGNFLSGLKQMPTTTNDNWFYQNWMPTFGTHYMNYTQLGAIYGVLATMDYYSYEMYTSSNLDISVSVSAFANSMAGCSQTDKEQQEAKYFHDETIKVYTFNFGASLPKNYSAYAWQQEVEKGEVGAIIIKIDWIYNLIETIDKNKALALKHATDNYCAYLKAGNPSLNCQNTPPPNPQPDASVFGGFYSFDNNEQDQANPYTNKAACKPGYEPQKITQNGQHGRDFYYCLDPKKKNSKGVYIDPMRLFGGIWQKNANTNQCLVGNLFMADKSCVCPGGFTQQYLLQAHWSQGDYFTTYICQNETAYETTITTNGHQEQTSFFGGAYQKASQYQSSNGFNNPYTKGLNCPAGFPDYKPYKMLNDWNCNQPTTCDSYWCLNNVYSLPSVQPTNPPQE